MLNQACMLLCEKQKQKEVKNLDVNFIEKDKLLLVKLTEEIDHCKTEELRRKVDYEIERYMPKKVIFDFDSVSFMDSAGIGFLLREI